MKQTHFLIIALLWLGSLQAQSRTGFSNLDRAPLNGLGFGQGAFDLFQSNKPSGINVPAITPVTPGIYNNTIQQNEMILRQLNGPSGADRVKQMADVERDIIEMKGMRDALEQASNSKSYQQAFIELCKMNPDSFSVEHAVFVVENAFLDGKFNESVFIDKIASRVRQVREILKKEGLNSKDELAVHYGIQKLFERNENQIVANKALPNFQYDFDDYRGEKDYTKMFASKALITGTGQCHSLPIVYLLLAEGLGAKAYLSLAPQHSFIQFRDKQGRLINFETTSGHLVSSSWITHSGYITALALSKKTFVAPLSKRQLFAHTLGDLLLGYLAKMNYDGFAEKMRVKILEIESDNLTALMLDANMKIAIAKEQFRNAGKPKEAELGRFPLVQRSIFEMQKALEKVESTGYQEMPEEAYKKWLNSLEKEKSKQAVSKQPGTQQQLKPILSNTKRTHS